MMRAIMMKFNVRDSRMGRVEAYKGDTLPDHTRAECSAIDMIRNSSLSYAKAKKTLTKMDPNAPITSLVELATLFAAVVVVFPERLDTVQEKTSLRKVLINACQPARFHWYMNNLKVRAMLPQYVERFLATGTTRNEQMHQRLNAHYKTTLFVAKRTLETELNTWVTAEMGVFLCALKGKLSRQVRRVDMLPSTTSSTTLFTTASWTKFSAESPPEWKTGMRSSKTKYRKGPTREQDNILKLVRDKIHKRSSKCVYSQSRSGVSVALAKVGKKGGMRRVRVE